MCFVFYTFVLLVYSCICISQQFSVSLLNSILAYTFINPCICDTAVCGCQHSCINPTSTRTIQISHKLKLHIIHPTRNAKGASRLLVSCFLLIVVIGSMCPNKRTSVILVTLRHRHTVAPIVDRERFHRAIREIRGA
jgi:hypothetical protein